MTRIVENQRRAFIAQAQDDARRLCASLVNLSDAQRAAILALIAAKTSTPIDIHYWADTGDRDLVAQIVSGVLIRGDEPDTYQLGSGCDLTVTPSPGSETSYE
jgi:hypothetical protein